MSSAACIFCKIIKGDIPSLKLFESDKVFAFLDIQPLSRGHAVRFLTIPGALFPAFGVPLVALVIPKFHGAKLTDIPDEDLTEILPVAKNIAKATGAEDFNILQNNGRIAHQVVDHVHFHMIPKPNEKEGLGIGWPTQATDMDKLKALHAEIQSKM
ncbi:Histidine triad (HIT) protein [Penicillium griseofulvum]|uniref:Histidine triad (HIT) protein n=1 Tax=Penicillium patulum TaxID=5078 RepID=A0A135LW69_PENPA|nr:Histidine triad (HIT) protein [Penicillium griseofulvum]KXG53218.1 Histidine triad (HIT) protein [Penicillium griseofulvum]